MSEVIVVRNLSKSFGSFKAVDDISFTVNSGEVYGFLGQNGAGKSTTIRMLLTLISPDSGSIEMFGIDLKGHRKEILQNVGAIVEKPDLYSYLTAYENLLLFAKISGRKVERNKIFEQLELVGLRDRADSRVKTFSQGMKQRLGIAVALVHDPDLIILDEPTNGLDPQGIADVRNLILHLSRHLNKTVFVSSHLLVEMEMVADRMLILDRGKAVKEGAIKNLLDTSSMIVQVRVAQVALALETMQGSEWYPFLVRTEADVIEFRMPESSVPDLTRYMTDAGISIYSVIPKHSLEQYFLSLTTANRHVDTFEN